MKAEFILDFHHLVVNFKDLCINSKIVTDICKSVIKTRLQKKTKETLKPFRVFFVFCSVMQVSELDEGWLGRIEDIFTRYGVRSVTMDDISNHLGISKKTLYQKIPNKDILICEVVKNYIRKKQRMIEETISRSANAIDENLLLMELSAQQFKRLNPAAIFELQKYHHQAWSLIHEHLTQTMMNLIVKNLERGQSEGLFREDFDPAVIAKFHLISSSGLFDPDWFDEESHEKSDIICQHIYHFLFGVVSPKGLTYLKNKINNHAA